MLNIVKNIVGISHMSPVKNSPDNKIIAKHVIQNIDAALEKGWVKVYYQPVIRALTGQLCGAESLARWIDPEYGFLSPDKFIGPLELGKQIHKLDCWIVDKVCSDISERLNKGLDAVPVSVNFSRLDFEAADMLQVVEDAVEKYDIPKDYIHIEITESMIASDAALMAKVIADFRKAGYEVWMDDFGSGYSSLNLLKDYHFDTLKLDMEFLSSFNDKSKAIMTYTISMSKDIGIRTLAEGVETEEQIAFLKSIGCGKLQGYFYGKPMPIDDFFAHIEEFGIGIEARQWRHFYEVASFNAKYTDEPLEILIDNGQSFRTLFMNVPYRQQILPDEYKHASLDEIDQLIYRPSSVLLTKYREYAGKLESSRNQEPFYYTANGNILCFKGEVLAEINGSYIIKGAIRNISSDSNIKTYNSMDAKLKELNNLFETITVINLKNNTFYPLIGNYRYIDKLGESRDKLDKIFEALLTNFVAATDREKLRKFYDVSTLQERIVAGGKSHISTVVRMKQQDGNYVYKEISILQIPGSHEKEFLFCTKATGDDIEEFLSSNADVFNSSDYGIKDLGDITYEKMWENTVNNSSIKFFWKDKNRRFLGASRAFLDYYGFTVEDILGKDDEDMGWHVDGKGYRRDELDVLQKGAIIKNAPGHCIVKGIVHNIICFKSPLYEKGHIVGLMGYFIDVDEELGHIDNLYNKKKRDPVTGLMNAVSLMETINSFAITYADKEINYGVIVLRNKNHHRITTAFGEKFSDRLLKKMADAILEVTEGNCAVARTIGSDFTLVNNASDKSVLEDMEKKLKEKLEGIKELDGNSITMKIQTRSKLRTEDGITDENIYHAALMDLIEDK